MADYKKMYHILFSAITNVIKELEDSVLESEETYISEEEKVLELIKLTNDKEASNE